MAQHCRPAIAWAAVLAAATPLAAPAALADTLDVHGMQEATGSVATPSEEPVMLPWAMDRSRRLTMKLEVAGTGPWDFVVDTGAERTILSEELARQLQLRAGPALRLATMTGVHVAPSASVRLTDLRRRRQVEMTAPLLAEAALGASGLIGVDLLADYAIRLDFREGRAVLRPATSGSSRTGSRLESGDIVVRARRQGGRLILTSARVNGVTTAVVIDSGAQHSVANPSFGRKMRGRQQRIVSAGLQSVTGAILPVEVMTARSIDLGGVRIEDLPIAVADSYAFTALGLSDRPAMLLGMDALSLFDWVDLDFVRRRVGFPSVPASR